MNKRQRVIDAINHKDTDLIPWNIEFTSKEEQRLRDYLGTDDVFDAVGNHMRRIKYKKMTQIADDVFQDDFGVPWKMGGDGGDIGMVNEYLLKEDDFGDYKFPELNKEMADDICNKLEADKDHFTMFSITIGYYERAWSLRSTENVLMDMILNPEFTTELFDKILEHHLNVLDYVLDRDFDAVYLGDDWGQQRGLIMGPKMWREFIKPGVKQIVEKVKSKGKYMVVHSCGDIEELFPDLIDMGVDVYNTVQPEIYDLAKIKKEYGKDLTFHGALSTQQFLPYATPDEVRVKVKELLDTMGGGGGYILSPTHEAPPDIPPENLVAMVETVKNYRR